MNLEEEIRVRKIKHPDIKDYYVSRKGIVYDKDYNELNSYIKNGYKNLSLNGRMFAVHRLVAMTFIKNINNCDIVNHIDENKLNNNVENLEWVTQKENCHKHSKIISHERRVIQKDLDNNIIATHNSVTKAGESINLTRHAINKACLGINKTAGGFIWEYENQENLHNNDVDITDSISIEDYPNYCVFNNGTIYNKQRKSFMKPVINAYGSHYITLSSANGKNNRYIHNIVATYFIPNENNCKYVRHIDKNKNNNNSNNLEWFN